MKFPIFSKFYNPIHHPNQPTIVFLHEALGSVTQWRDFPNKLMDLTGFNAFAYDRLGHGMSGVQTKKRDLNYLHHEAWDILPSVLAANNIENPILFGHSDGGTIALLYASKFTTKVIIAEAAHVINEAITVGSIHEIDKRKDYFIEKLQRHHGDKAADLWSAWTESWTAEMFKNWNIEAVLPNIACPALIIQGENDEYGTEEQVKRIAHGIGKTAQTWMIPECGHAPHRDYEAAVLNRTFNFLK
jgi:pimeloyl-ACP methyl ester carboxylesterase